MSELALSYSGYVCAPYLHTHESVELKESWINSKNIEKLFFVTGTFSSESKPYFSDSTNHYILAKFKDSERISKDLSKFNQNKTSFVFNIKDDLFQREVQGETNFVTVYYVEYGEDDEDLQEIANILLKRDKIEKAGLGNMNTFCTTLMCFLGLSEQFAKCSSLGRSYCLIEKICFSSEVALFSLRPNDLFKIPHIIIIVTH